MVNLSLSWDSVADQALDIRMLKDVNSRKFLPSNAELSGTVFNPSSRGSKLNASLSKNRCLNAEIPSP